jgi:hypothetical protein
MAVTENDYAGATGSFARLTPNAGNTTITGFAGGIDGRILTITNIGNPVVVINHQDGGSLAANRIITKSGVSFVIPTDGIVSFIYDATTQRWRQTTTL